MEFSSNRTSVVAIWASLVPTAVSGADVMGFGMCRSNNWTFAVIASITMGPQCTRFWPLFVVYPRNNGQCIFCLQLTYASLPPATIYLWPVYLYSPPTSCFFYKRLAGVTPKAAWVRLIGEDPKT